MGKFHFTLLAAIFFFSHAWANGNEGLNDFVVYSKKDLITIQWKAKKNESTKSFNYCIQRSHDGVKFETIICVFDQGDMPNIEEFIETDFNPLPGWSYYRLVKLDEDKIVEQTAVATVFFGLDRVSKGQVIAPSFAHMQSSEKVDLEDFNNSHFVFVLRNLHGQEDYIKSDLHVSNSDQLSIATGEEVPIGIYRIASCSNEALLGLEMSVEH